MGNVPRDKNDPPLWCPDCKQIVDRATFYYTGTVGQDWDPETKTWSEEKDEGFEILADEEPVCQECGADLEDFDDQETADDFTIRTTACFLNKPQGCQDMDPKTGKCDHGLVPYGSGVCGAPAKTPH